jgi:hypothetical protein
LILEGFFFVSTPSPLDAIKPHFDYLADFSQAVRFCIGDHTKGHFLHYLRSDLKLAAIFLMWVGHGNSTCHLTAKFGHQVVFNRKVIWVVIGIAKLLISQTTKCLICKIARTVIAHACI